MFIIEDGWDGSLQEGKFFQKSGFGGNWYEWRAWTSGHFFLAVPIPGESGNFIFGSGSIHLSIVLQLSGKPILNPYLGE
jgi:hypothetical protein